MREIKSERKSKWLIFAGALFFTLAFAVYTQHAWEDYYITYRVSKNLATGQGMVFTVGQRVHAFTSPLNTLLPAWISMATGNRSDVLVLWLYRILCSMALAGAAVLLFDSARKNSLGAMATAVLVGMFCVDAKIVDFSINGQEVAYMMLFLALALHALTVQPEKAMLKLGLAGAGLMWTRPDGFIYLGVLAIGFLLFNSDGPTGKSRSGLLKMLAGAAVITTVLYLPWLFWAWHYYGSPVPHSMMAKRLFNSLAENPRSWRFLLTHPLDFFSTTAGVFQPTYFEFGGWPWPVSLYGNILGLACNFYWLLPSGRIQGKAASLAFMLGNYYHFAAMQYAAPWYRPSCAIMGIFVIAQIVQQCVETTAALKNTKPAESKVLMTWVRLGVGAVLSVGLAITVCAAYQLRIQQREIEEGNRQKIALALKEHAASAADTVFLECLGYIGYYSQLKMYDFPGLSSPEVTDTEERLRTLRFSKLVPALHPDWLVLRPSEVSGIQNDTPDFLATQYTLVAMFDASTRIAAYNWLPGRGYLLYDQKFAIFRHKKADLDNQAKSLQDAPNKENTSLH